MVKDGCARQLLLGEDQIVLLLDNLSLGLRFFMFVLPAVPGSHTAGRHDSEYDRNRN